jgi:hypothetical protein
MYEVEQNEAMATSPELDQPSNWLRAVLDNQNQQL